MLPEIERFQKWLRRKAPHASTQIHYTNDLELFFAWLNKPPELCQLIALVVSLRTGALNAIQTEAVRQLRAGMVALAERECANQVVNVPSPAQECPTGESSQTIIAI